MKNKEARVLVIIPAYNEEGRIGLVVESINKVLPQADVLVINDDSADRTREEALAAGAIVLPHPANLGYGASLETGYMYANQSGYDMLLQMDADGQHPADQLPKLIEPLNNGVADLVIGSRYADKDSTYKTPALRRLGQKIFSGLIFAATHLRLSDPTSGFQALNRRTLALFASGVFPCDYPDADVLLMSHMAGLRIKEIPVVMHNRSGGQSMHSGLKPVYYAMKMFLSVFIVLLNVGLWRKWQRSLKSTL